MKEGFVCSFSAVGAVGGGCLFDAEEVAVEWYMVCPHLDEYACLVTLELSYNMEEVLNGSEPSMFPDRV